MAFAMQKICCVYNCPLNTTGQIQPGANDQYGSIVCDEIRFTGDNKVSVHPLACVIKSIDVLRYTQPQNSLANAPSLALSLWKGIEADIIHLNTPPINHLKVRK